MTVKKSDVYKIIALYGSSFINMVLGVLTSILNTRILGTASFGDLKFIETIVRFFASVTTAGFFVSITRLIAINNNKSYQKKCWVFLLLFF
ncbi:oligosaccharide flippase family protein [Maribacter aestuarii]|uniref:oligosaccharide flippase family protein n=1 Tax=Maribacter aestuarii TaxID=1130723 RepID=UPI0025A619FE|nr:oligosaccharide flippase family protein [Maribacter aestuarii]